MAVEAVLTEPLSATIPCYQGLIQGFLTSFAENVLAFRVNPQE
jgi:hypothetical protein